MELDSIELLTELRRKLSSIEHMVYVSCKITKNTEMLHTGVKALLEGYELFFEKGYSYIIGDSSTHISFLEKIKILSENFEVRGITVDLSDYTLLKRILISDYEAIGEYRKNLSLIVYIDDNEIILNLKKLTEFYKNLSSIYETLNPEKIY